MSKKFKKFKPKVEKKEEYYLDFPTEPIGGDNPYHCCSYCKVSVPKINGHLDRHLPSCQYRLDKEGKK